MAIEVAVVIPFFQRDPGILRRALMSLLRQRLLPGLNVRVVVVDDGSPVPAQSEVEGLPFALPFHLMIIPQKNAGVGAARNTALKFIGASSTYVAFLDSDDCWHENHLEQGIRALEAGNDFYFCDNYRAAYHDSYFAKNCPQILPFAESPDANGVAEIPNEALIRAILKGFPTQASTVIYRREIFPNHRFPENLRAAGEDVLFFVQLAEKSRKSCFSPKVMVDCGEGINLYFGNYSWDSPARLAIALDQVVAHSLIAKHVDLTRDSKDWLKYLIAAYERDFVFFCLRYFKKQRKMPPEFSRMSAGRRWYPIWFAFTAIQIAIMMPLGLYRPR